MHYRRTTHTQVLYTTPIGNPLLPCQYRGDGGCTELYTGCTTKRRLRAICLPGVRATVKPINAITRGGQIGIDGEHRSFRIIPALSVIKRESRPVILHRIPVGSAGCFIRFCLDDAAATHFTSLGAIFFSLFLSFSLSFSSRVTSEFRLKNSVNAESAMAWIMTAHYRLNGVLLCGSDFAGTCLPVIK